MVCIKKIDVTHYDMTEIEIVMRFVPPTRLEAGLQRII
jgi:hypothetical protein